MSRIVIGNEGSLAGYAQGGGHWSVFLQYLLGLQSLGHDVLLLEAARADEGVSEAEVADRFFGRLAQYGLAELAALVIFDPRAPRGDLSLREGRIHGTRNAAEIHAFAAGTDVLWNVAGSLKGQLLAMFPHRVFLDLDPAVVHLSALEWDMGLKDHDAFLSVGGNVGNADCGVPTLGLSWRTFVPFVHLPMWPVRPDPGQQAPFTSVTHWNWCSVDFQGRSLSMSKRDAYLEYAHLPQQTGVPFEVAIAGADEWVGDPEGIAQMKDGGWRISDAWRVADTPAAYRSYIAASRGELCCPKPLHCELRTGWISDRSVCYLASGRPVLMKDTGLQELVPAEGGMVLFEDMETAREAAASVASDYESHCRAARRLAEQMFSAATVLPQMITSSG